MCGRFTQTKSREEVLEVLGGIELPPLFHGRYNVAPTQKVAVIRQSAPERADECIWGLEPLHAGAPVINARIETLRKRPMFRDLFSDNRCLIPADGFYEWKDHQPYYFHLPDRSLFAFAGLWRKNRCTIITRSSSASMQGIHERMPVILALIDRDAWLDGGQLPPPPSLTMRPVSTRVNKVSNDDPACLDPADEQVDLPLFPDSE